MRRCEVKKLISACKGAYSAIIFLFLYLPIVVLIVLSFNESSSRAVWGGFSLKWYTALLENSSIRDALVNTLFIAAASAAIATVVGTAAAIGINSMRRLPQTLITNLTYIPVTNADIVTGVSLMVLFMFLSIPFGRVSLLLAHVTFNIPYVILSVMPKLHQMNKHSYEAALDLGCTPLGAIIKVVIPEIMPGIITGAILAFTLSIDDFVISFFTKGDGINTLSTVIYTAITKGTKLKNQINALSAVMFIVVLALLIVVNVRASKDARERERAARNRARHR